MKTMFRSILSLFMILVVFVSFAPAEASAEQPDENIEYVLDMSVDEVVYELSNHLTVINIHSSEAEPSVNPYAMKRNTVKNQKYLSDLKHYESPILSEQRYRDMQKRIE